MLGKERGGCGEVVMATTTKEEGEEVSTRVARIGSEEVHGGQAAMRAQRGGTTTMVAAWRRLILKYEHVMSIYGMRGTPVRMVEVGKVRGKLATATQGGARRSMRRYRCSEG